MTDSVIAEVLAENGLEENSGSYDDYRDALNVLHVGDYAYAPDKEEVKKTIKQYFNIP
jgi:hypothetical protein